MPLTSQPGSDHQLAQVTLDAGHARDIMLMLLDVHAVLDHLYLDGTQPQVTAPAEDYLREAGKHLQPAGSYRRARRSDQHAQPRRARSAPRHTARPARLRTSRKRSGRRHLLTTTAPSRPVGARSKKNSPPRRH